MKEKNEPYDKVPIIRGIPRFNDSVNYTDNFGIQWNKFRTTQLDSVSKLPLTFNRFWNNTKWKPKDIVGKTVLEVGSGAGRFTEILLEAGASIVSFDYSNAVDANYLNNKDKGDLLIFQGDLYQIPFEDNSFDFIFCFGVLQHTPDPVIAYRSIFRKLSPGGFISIDYYRKFYSPHVFSTPKYLWRPITSKMVPSRLFKIIQFYIPLWLPIDTIIRKIPKIGPFLLACIPIPCWNYVKFGLTHQQRKEWAIMDTFDALSPRYDQPKTLEEVREMIDSPENSDVEVFYGSNGIVANITKKIKTESCVA